MAAGSTACGANTATALSTECAPRMKRKIESSSMRDHKRSARRDTNRAPQKRLSDSPPNPGNPSPSLTPLPLRADLPIPKFSSNTRIHRFLPPFSLGPALDCPLQVSPLRDDPRPPHSCITLWWWCIRRACVVTGAASGHLRAQSVEPCGPVPACTA